MSFHDVWRIFRESRPHLMHAEIANRAAVCFRMALPANVSPAVKRQMPGVRPGPHAGTRTAPPLVRVVTPSTVVKTIS
jgi:hypothetical protein